MNSKGYPKGTKIAIKIDRLIKDTGRRSLSEKMSSRMVRCASVLSQGEYAGWQMIVPTKGLLEIVAFGTEELTRGDLEWILENTGKTSKCAMNKEPDKAYMHLYEIYLPIAEGSSRVSTIGFTNMPHTETEDDNGTVKWPDCYTEQFEELVKALRVSGAAVRIVAGPATDEERTQCQKEVLNSYDVRSVSPIDYIGKPVKIRALMLLPAAPTARIKTIIEEFVHGARLRYIGTMNDQSAAEIWDSPLERATVLPDYAARVLMMEPEAREAFVGIEICEEEVKKIPAGHKNPKDQMAVTIGRAIDATGIRRRITIGETDLKRHYQIVGQTGTGKSTLLTTIILSAIERGHGLTFFDPHGSTIDVVLRSLPEKYASKVRVVRVGDADNPVPLNVWDSDDPAKEEKNINDLCDLFADIFDPRKEGFLGPRWERWFATFAKASIAFLGRRASLESIAIISQSQDNMLKVSKAIISKYPELVETIKQEYGTDKSNDFHQTLNWYLCKFQRLLAVEQLRKTLGAGANALDFRRTIDTAAVTLIDLASPVIGTHASRIIGTLLLMKLWNAILDRKNRDKTHLVVVDEASLFQSNPMPRMLAESRKFGVSVVLSHQHAGQLTQEIRDALEANSANFSAFRLSPRDAATAAIRFDDPQMQVALTRLDAFNAITTISVDGKQSNPFTLEIERPKLQKNGEEIAKRIEVRSIESLVKRYQKVRALTSAEILDLLNHPENLPKQEQNPEPRWLQEWTHRRNSDLKIVV